MKNMRLNLKTILFLFLALGFVALEAQVKLPNIFSDNMVLQRDQPIHIWGWANAGEKIEVEFKEQKVKVKASKEGKWDVYLKESVYGGPYSLTVKGDFNLTIYKNVLVGDVWLCSGQSNMEWLVKNSNDAQNEIANSDYPNIRLFTVGREINNHPQENVTGEWKVCASVSVGDFSAVGYFFGREISKNTNIPIGLVSSSWGGTVAEAWTSPEMMNTVPSFKLKMDEISKMDLKIFVENNKAQKDKYEQELKNDKGFLQKWNEKFPTETQKMKVPGSWQSTDLSNMDGIVWFRTEFELPPNIGSSGGTLSLGMIDDKDLTWINGVEIGKTDGYNKERIYKIPEGVLKSGKNELVINVTDYARDGGIYGKEDNLYLVVGNVKYSLSGIWDYCISVDSRKYNYNDFGPNSYPSLLYNGMIAPLIKYPIKGVIWYQGESNDYDANLYRTLFPNLINDWRNKWKSELPFYWVQLANFRAPDQKPTDSKWAAVREAQTMALKLPKTGQAVTIDIGQEKDIHPRNKQDVGKRLALHALKNEYGKSNIVNSGPIYKSIRKEGNKIIVTFDAIGSGLYTTNKYGYVNGFAIAGDDGIFVWAKAEIKNNEIIVYTSEVKDPVAIRYAWSDNPGDASLYNVEGLPACHFSAKVQDR